MKMGMTEALFGGAPILVLIIVGAICGMICMSISKSRGMTGGYWWGFFLGIIGIIIVAVRPNDKAQGKITPNVKVNSATEELEKAKQLLDNGAITPEEYETMKKKIIDKQ